MENDTNASEHSHSFDIEEKSRNELMSTRILYFLMLSTHPIAYEITSENEAIQKTSHSYFIVNYSHSTLNYMKMITNDTLH